MPVTKTTRECYEVREAHEWANITLRCWSRPANVGTPHECIYYCGEIAIHSSFGTWAHAWSACATPFKHFLVASEFDYLFGKFMGAALLCYDGKETLRRVRQKVLAERRKNSLDRSEARDVWQAVKSYGYAILSDSGSEAGNAMFAIADKIGRRNPMHGEFADPCAWDLAQRHDTAATEFWRLLWPAFSQQLKAEIDAEAGQPEAA